MRTIRYAVDTETGFVVSRVGGEVAWPVLDYDKMLPENNYAMGYRLEKMTLFSVAGRPWAGLNWTRKIPKKVKNEHRKFWGFELLN